MKIIIPGGSGHVGALLARSFHDDGHDVVVLSRTPAATPWRTIAWDAVNSGDWEKEIDGADVVINLAGRSVNCRYTPENRKAIMDSRIDSTRAVGRAIAAAPTPPPLWLQMSTATIYAHRFDAPNDEFTGIIGGSEPGVPESWHFSIEVATAWERALNELDLPSTRRVALRAAMVMTTEREGIFDTLLGIVRRGLGGSSAGGRQYISWIHGDDFVRAIRWLIERSDIDGPVNIAAPEPLPNREFMEVLRSAWGAKLGLPSTKWMLELGAFLMRTDTELILKSRRVIPGRLLDSGFTFQFPTWRAAAIDLCTRWRSEHL
jgi:uncharacterized protein (TIGR01777 family)